MDILCAAKGKIVSHVWFGDYQAMYVELGQLSPPKRNNPQGEVTVYAGYRWHGEIVKPEGAAILGATVSNIEVQENSELLIEFSNGVRLSTDSGEEPEWCVTLANRAHLSVEEGRLHVEPA